MEHTLSTDIAKKLAEHASHLETLNRVAKAIASGIDLGQILQAVTSAATELSGARFGAFFCKVANEEGERYRLAALSGPAPAEFELLANRTSFESAFHGTVVARSDDIRTDLRFDKPTSLFGTPGGLPLASYLAVPVVSNSGEVHGGLFLGHDEAGMFTAEAEQLVAGIAAHAAIALDNARLLQSAQSELLECKRQELAPQRLAAIVESSDDAILAKELNGIITSWNKGAERIFGYKEEEVIGKPITILFPEDRYNEEPVILARIRSGERVDHYETVRRRKDGSLIDISLTVSPVKDAMGRVIGASKIARDITERKRQEIAAQRLAAIVESSDDAILAKDLNGIITSWNKGAERIFGYKEEEVIGKPVTILIPEDRHNEEPAILARIRSGQRVDHYETVRRRKDGSLIDISLTVSPVKDTKGRVIGASKIARDITERKRAEQQQNLLLREMSHRVKNLFSVASSIVALSARGAATPEELALSMQERLAALGRAHDLTLTKPAGHAPVQTQPTTLHALIQAVLLPFESKEPGDAKRATVTGLDIPLAGSQVTAFALLLHEFATNAAKYGALSAPSGRIGIECSEKNGEITIEWRESGGPSLAQENEEDGFGSLLVRATVKHQLGGEIVREWKPEGLRIRITFPMERIASAPKPELATSG